MSVRTMARVWEHSQHAGSKLLMLLAIADFADDAGFAFPAVPTLADKCRLKLRYANDLLAALKASGELEIFVNRGPKAAESGQHTNLFKVSVPAKGLRPGAPLEGCQGLRPGAERAAPGCLEALRPGADKPSLNHQEPKKAVARKRASSAGKTFQEWMEEAKGNGEKRHSDAQRAYLAKVALPVEFASLAWDVFKAKHLASAKRQENWRGAFDQALRGNWLKLWYFDRASGAFVLSTPGVLAAREHGHTNLAHQ